jgi:hypothetical protein
MATERTELAPAELLRLLRAELQKRPDDVPKGWKTAEQWAKDWDVTPNAAGIVLSRSVRIGLIETKKFRIQTANRGNHPTPHYRPTNEIQIKSQP